ncbi:MAG TPA: transposase, partial [Thiobacillaceae bacterium]|nr:transposase [Thiobacillaceae bacterium]HNU65240.1 transposase [Thiobacillaceae bacterium]
MKERYTEEQIIGFLREAETGLPIKELCRRHEFSEASYYLWRSRFGGMTVSDGSCPWTWCKERSEGHRLW